MVRLLGALLIAFTIVSTAAQARTNRVDRVLILQDQVAMLLDELDVQTRRMNATAKSQAAQIVTLQKRLDTAIRSEADRAATVQKQLDTITKSNMDRLAAMQKALDSTVKLDGEYSFKTSSGADDHASCLAVENVLPIAGGMNDKTFATLCDSGLAAALKNWVIQAPRVEAQQSSETAR